jgi:hypothetical protein
MGSYKRRGVFDPLDLEIIDLVYEAALTQIAARDRLFDPMKEVERQEEIKKLVFAVAKPGAVEFDALLDSVLDRAAKLFQTDTTPLMPPEVEGGAGQRQLKGRLRPVS